jgi:putative Holliday junction resolvase
VLPGNNYHVYDYALFWGSIRADAERRLAAWRRDDHTTAAEFAPRCRMRGKLAGLDVGTKTIGLAICDAGWSFAGPPRPSADQVHRRPRSAEGLHRRRHRRPGRRPAAQPRRQRFSPRTQSVRAFARNLAPLGLPILLWDERWSTQAVERAMIDADVSRAKRAELVDKLAAAHILQGAIDAADRHGRRWRSRTEPPCSRSAVGDRPDILALQIDVEDGEVEAALLDLLRARATVSQVPRTLWPSESRKSSSIIAISGSSSTIRMERAPSMRIGHSSARRESAKGLFGADSAAPRRLGQFLDREGLGQEGDIGRCRSTCAAAPRHSRT